jgi:hypothetical protein
MLPPAFAADSNDPIVGTWKWFTKGTRTFHTDGTVTPDGTWKCVNPGGLPHKYVIVWGDGTWVDTMVLGKEEKHLSGHNQKGVPVSGDRLSREDPAVASNPPPAGGNAPATAGTPPATAGTAPAATSNTPATVNLSSLTEPLAPYIQNLEVLLSLRRISNKENKAFLTQASGKLITVRQGIVVESEKVSDQKKAPFNAALKTCDLISAALAERSQVLGDLKASGAVVNDGRLEEPGRKDNLTQGIHGDGLAKAVGSIVERDREREAADKAAHRAKSTDHALTAMAENNWTKRSAEWMQQIAAAYGGIRACHEL